MDKDSPVEHGVYVGWKHILFLEVCLYHLAWPLENPTTVRNCKFLLWWIHLLHGSARKLRWCFTHLTSLAWLTHDSFPCCLIYEVVLRRGHELIDLVWHSVCEWVIESILAKFPLKFEQPHVLLMQPLPYETLPMLFVKSFIDQFLTCSTLQFLLCQLFSETIYW